MFAMAIVALVGPSLNTVIGVIIIASIPVYARVVRTQTLALRERDFIVDLFHDVQNVTPELEQLCETAMSCADTNWELGGKQRG